MFTRTVNNNMIELGIPIRYRHNTKRNIVFLSVCAAVKCLIVDKDYYDNNNYCYNGLFYCFIYLSQISWRGLIRRNTVMNISIEGSADRVRRRGYIDLYTTRYLPYTLYMIIF